MNMIDSEKQLCYENFIYIALGLSPSQALTNGRLLGLHGWVGGLPALYQTFGLK